MSDHIAANPIRHLIEVLRIISNESVTRTELEIKTGISRATLARLLYVARNHCGVKIEFVRKHNLRDGYAGYYRIINYGVFSRQKIRGDP